MITEGQLKTPILKANVFLGRDSHSSRCFFSEEVHKKVSNSFQSLQNWKELDTFALY